MMVPNMGFAPANPHLIYSGYAESASMAGRRSLSGPTMSPAWTERQSNSGAFANCRQCHMFQLEETMFRQTEFVGLPQQRSIADRLYPGAPPVMPHSVWMRENCLACHAGPAARPEIVCTHPERLHCLQCHMQTIDTSTDAFNSGE
jgi:hypothetical protein